MNLIQLWMFHRGVNCNYELLQGVLINQNKY
jgi:hypothetical protein